MTQVPVKYTAGTQKAPQQTKLSQPCFTDTDHVHFPDGVLATIDPYAVSPAISDYVKILGGLRSIHAQKLTGVNQGTYRVHGSNMRLYAEKNSTLYNITPFADQKSESLGADPIAVHSGDATVTLTWAAHGLSVGDAITLSGAEAVDGFTASALNVEHTVATVPDANSITFEMGSNAASTTTGGGAFVTVSSIGLAATLGANPISVTNTSKVVTVTYTAHGLAIGDRIKLRDATATGGVTAAMLNIEHIVATVPTANTFTILSSGAASSTTTGGGSVVRIYKQIAKGNLNQGAASGAGAGIVGEGIVGIGGAAVAAQSYPRIWSLAQFGNDIVMCAGDYISGDGQKIYLWDGDVSKAPTVLANAPTNCQWVDVVNNAIVALCEKQVKIGQLGDGTVWSGITAWSSRELDVWKLISTKVFTDKQALIFTQDKAFLLNYTGGTPDLWDLREVFNEDGIISPRSCCILNATIFWRGNRGSYAFSGSYPKLIDNSQNDEWIKSNTNYAQVWKSFAYADPASGEWWWHFPSGVNNEPSDYVIHNIKDNSHTLGFMNRTAAQQVPMLDSTFIMANSTSESTEGTLYRHFLTSGTVTFNWYAETSFSYAANGELRGFIDRFMPDSNQGGSANLQVLTKEWMQGDTITSSAYAFTDSTQYITTKAGGKLFAFKFSGNRSFTLGSWLVNVITRGRR
jgi:hypothetical protein